MAVEAIELRAPQAGLRLVTPDSLPIAPPLTIIQSVPDSTPLPEIPVTPIVVDKYVSKTHQDIVLESVISLKGGQDYSRLLKPAEPYVEPPILPPLIPSFSIFDQTDIM